MKQAFFTQSSPLPTEYVSGEGVTKRLVYRDCDTEVSILEIAPGAGINWHYHLSDSEIYLQPSTGNGELCQKGDGHNKNQGCLQVNGKGHNHGAEYNKGRP